MAGDDQTQTSTGTQSTAAAAAAPAAGDQPTTDTDQSDLSGLSVEEINQRWQHRVSQNDKAHAAEVRTLREQHAASQRALDEMRRQQEQARLAGMSEAERVAAERDQLRQQLETERQMRVIDTRKARFPHIAAELDDQALAVMDEGKLAALNDRLGSTAAAGQPPSLIDANSAARSAAGNVPTRVEDMTTDQLKEQLRREEQSFMAEVGLTRSSVPEAG